MTNKHIELPALRKVTAYMCDMRGMFLDFDDGTRQFYELDIDHEIEDDCPLPLAAHEQARVVGEPVATNAWRGVIHRAAARLDKAQIFDHANALRELLASPPAPQEAQADSTPLLPVARIRSWTKHGEGHGDLVDWLEGSENLPDGEYDLYLGPQSEQKPVASIYISPNGEREFDDWKHDLPIGRNELFAAPVAQQATEQAEAPSDTLRVACITLDGSTLYIPAKEITDFGIGDDDGETYTLTFKTMTRAEFEALGEFDGF